MPYGFVILEDSMKRKKLKTVKHRLVDLDMSVSDLARKMGVSLPFVSAIINGAYVPTLEHKEKMSKALGCRQSDLFPAE